MKNDGKERGLLELIGRIKGIKKGIEGKKRKMIGKKNGGGILGVVVDLKINGRVEGEVIRNGGKVFEDKNKEIGSERGYRNSVWRDDEENDGSRVGRMKVKKRKGMREWEKKREVNEKLFWREVEENMVKEIVKFDKKVWNEKKKEWICRSNKIEVWKEKNDI